MSVPTTEPVEYEFAPDHERRIGELGGRMQVVGAVMLVVGLAGVGWMIYSWSRGVGFVELSSVLLVIAGGWTIPAGRAFSKVASTRGRDVTHLIRAVDDLRRLFAILHAALLAAIFLLVLLVFLQRPAGG